MKRIVGTNALGLLLLAGCGTGDGAESALSTSLLTLDSPLEVGTEETGACCLLNCFDLTADVCELEGGLFGGVGTSCATFECNGSDTEACCLPDGSCVETDAEDCVTQGGQPGGLESTCANTECTPPPTEACCLPDGSCVETSAEDCAAQGGESGGLESTCANTECAPPPTEACCLPDGSCVETSAEDCVAQGGEPGGLESTCENTECTPPTEACCLPDGSCVETSAEDCVAQGGEPGGLESTCANTECTPPTEACCLPDGSCVETSAEDCAAQGGEPQGPESNCETAVCEEGGDEGCTLGYWKNHPDAWLATNFTTGTLVGNVFTLPAAFNSLGSATLLEALDFEGGPQLIDKAALLIKQAVAGLLSADHPGVDYAVADPQDLINAVNAALASLDKDTIGDLKDEIDADNNAGCPLN